VHLLYFHGEDPLVVAGCLLMIGLVVSMLLWAFVEELFGQWWR